MPDIKSKGGGGVLMEIFFVEYNLLSVELSTSYTKQFNKQLNFLWVGVFHEVPFTPIHQYQINMPIPIRRWLRQKQLQLGRKLAPILPFNINVEMHQKFESFTPRNFLPLY
jgi:hypothetical protein